MIILKLETAINDDSKIIDKKNNDYNRHLASKLTTRKTSSEKKIPLIPPLLHNNTLITDFKQKG